MMVRFLLDALVTLATASTVMSAHAGELEVLSARQAGPGNVVITIALQTTASPKPADLALQLDDAPLVRATAVTSTATPAAPAWLMLCLDRSGSIGPTVLEGLKAGLYQALVEGRPGRLPFKVAILAFATQSTHVLDFTNDPALVAAAIQRLTVDGAPAGRTRMHDAIAGGLAALKAQGEGGKRLIIVSDGKDEGSITPATKLAELAQGPPRITIDALALGALAQDHSGAISTVAGSSGGRFLPSPDLKDVARPLRRLIDEAAPVSRFDIAFFYNPAGGARTAESAALVYGADSVAPSRNALRAGFAALNVSAPSAPESKFTINIDVALNWLRNTPPLLMWLASALLAAALALLYQRIRNSKDSSEDSVIVVKEKLEVVLPIPAEPVPRVRGHTAVGHTWQAPAPRQPTVILHGVLGAGRGQMVAVDKPLFRVGCDPDNDLVLVGDDFASGVHALLRFEAGGLYVEDLGSTNGTHLNGGTFKSATRSLSPGDELGFGHTTYQLLTPQQAGQPAGRSGFEPSPDD
jgi:hypothetical protein